MTFSKTSDWVVAVSELWFPLTTAEAWELARLIFSNRQKEFDDLSAKERQRYLELEEKLYAFLWRLCCHETHDTTFAKRALAQARNAFLAHAGWSPQLKPTQKAATWLVWRLHTPRSWLWRQAVQTIRQMESGQWSDEMDETNVPALDPPWNPPATLVGLAGCCQLKFFPPQPGTHPPKAEDLQKRRRPPKLIAQGHCSRSCDILFMVLSLEFKKKEVGYALGLPTSTAGDRQYDCEGMAAQWQRAKEVKNPSPALAAKN